MKLKIVLTFMIFCTFSMAENLLKPDQSEIVFETNGSIERETYALGSKSYGAFRLKMSDDEEVIFACYSNYKKPGKGFQTYSHFIQKVDRKRQDKSIPFHFPNMNSCLKIREYLEQMEKDKTPPECKFKVESKYNGKMKSELIIEAKDKTLLSDFGIIGESLDKSLHGEKTFIALQSGEVKMVECSGVVLFDQGEKTRHSINVENSERNPESSNSQVLESNVNSDSSEVIQD